MNGAWGRWSTSFDLPEMGEKERNGMKIILVLSVAVGVIFVLLFALTVILYGIADILPDTIEAIDKTREWLKKRREEKDGAERK